MRSLFVVILLFCSQLLSAIEPQAYVKGRITDSQNGEPLPGVMVLFKKTKGTVTDAKGNYFIQTEAGALSVTFRMLGYKNIVRNLQLKAEDTLILNIALSPDAIEMDQVVVTASRVEQRMAELTVSMTVIKPELIASQHITNAEELINNASGIEVLDGQASIRGGSGFSYGAGSRVLALVDGLPIISADAGNIRWQFLPLDNLNQIEIIKGASSTAYGSSAINGVINFRTADATSTPSTLAYLEGGIFDKPSRESWFWWDEPRVFSTVGFNHLRKIGHTDVGIGGNVARDNGYRKRNENNVGRVNLKVKHFDQKVEGLVYGLALNGGINHKTDFVLWENADTGGLIQDTSTAIFLKSTFYTIDPFVSYKKPGKFSHDIRMRMQGSQNNFPDSEQNNSIANTFYAEYQFWYHFNEKFSLNAGVTQTHNTIISNFYSDHNSQNIGGFVQGEFSAMDRLKLVAGIRLEHNSLDGVSDNLTPLVRSGVNYKLFDYTFLRASFGQGYRYPSIAERYASTTLGAVKIFPNLHIKAESGWNTELGIKQALKTKHFTGQVDVAMFYSQYIDMIEYVFGVYPNQGSETFSYGFRAENIEASRVYGVEIEWVLNNQLGEVKNSLSGGYVYLFPVVFNPYTGENTDLMLKYRRHHAAKLSWNSTYRKLDAGFSLYAKSKILRIDEVFLNELTRESLLPGFYDYWQTGNTAHVILDFQVGYLISEYIKLSMAVKNLTNVEYMGRPGDVQPQRSFSLRISSNF